MPRMACSLLIASYWIKCMSRVPVGEIRDSNNPNLYKTSSILLHDATWKCQQNWKRMWLAHTAASSSPY